MIPADVPSPIDLTDMKDAREWERTAMQRPFREDFFAAITAEISARHNPGLQVLELGSGPGFLAEYALSGIHDITYTMLDYSAAMHELARLRLSGISGNTIHYLERSFKANSWSDGINQVDVVATIQAVHELRHKRYAPDLFMQVHQILNPGGVLLFCDHYYGDDGLSNDQLYMSRTEQQQALENAGFTVSEMLVKGGRALYKALPDYK